MSFRMNVRVDEVFDEGAYRAVLENVEEKDTKSGPRLMWTFELVEKNAEVVGFTSMSPSTRANAYQWAKVIMGEIDPKAGWGPEDVIGGECIVVLEVGKDTQGFEKNKVADFEIDQDIDETGAVDISTNVSQSGDNSNQCVAPLQFGNTGNLQNAQVFVQFGGFGGFDRDRHDRFFDFDTNVGDVEFEGSTFEFTPELTNTCDQSVEQAAAAG